MNADGQLPDQFIGLYGDELMNVKLLSEDNDVLNRLLHPVAFTKPKVHRIKWLTKLFTLNPDLLAAYDTQQADDFRTGVRLQTRSASKNLRKHYQELYDTMNHKGAWTCVHGEFSVDEAV